MRYLLFAQLLFLAMPLVAFGKVTQEQVNVRLVTDEAETVLNLLAKRKANEPISDADWQQLFTTEGYVRLKQRETSLQRSFEDTDFKTFVLSEQLAARAPALREALDKWKRADITRAARLALNYLPKDAPAALIESFCDQRKLLSTYNRAAEKYNRTAPKPLSLWSKSLVDRLT